MSAEDGDLAGSAGRPNIVFLLSDQHQADAVGRAGAGLVSTPNLDRLAAEGASFGAAYCQGPLCVPARASLLTERYVSDHGAKDNRWTAGRPTDTVVRRIRDAGYHTAAIGKMHLYKYPDDVRDGQPLMHAYGFVEADEILGKYGCAYSRSPYTDYLEERGLLAGYRRFLLERDPAARAELPGLGLRRLPHWSTESAPMAAEHHPDAWVGRRAEAWIRDRSAAEPFFLWVGFPGPHDPWDAPPEFAARYQGIEISLPASRRPPTGSTAGWAAMLESVRDYSDAATVDEAIMRSVRLQYYAGVSQVDDAIGRVVAALKDRGLLERTWVVYSSDHGELLGAHGLFTKTLFYDEAVRVPLIIRPPSGRPAPAVVTSLVEHVDLAATLRDIVGAAAPSGSRGHSLQPLMGRSAGGARDFVRSECCDYSMYRTERYKVVVHQPDYSLVQMFDLVNDPHEDHDLSGSPAHQVTARQLLDRISAA
jgi:arylsulfatase